MIELPDVTDLDFLPFRQHATLLHALGSVALAQQGRDVIVHFIPHKSAINAINSVHGGAVATLFDIALHQAAVRAIAPEGNDCGQFQEQMVTSALEIKYLRPGQAGTAIYFVAQSLKTGRTLTSCIGAAFQNSQIIAYASGQFVKTMIESSSSPPAQEKTQ